MKVDKSRWIKMQNVNKVKKLKVLILKDECLKDQNQSFDDDEYDWFQQSSSKK